MVIYLIILQYLNSVDSLVIVLEIKGLGVGVYRRRRESCAKMAGAAMSDREIQFAEEAGR